ncbi:MAG: hypothetical protein MI974_11395 [Chitinophagales bacterium]|nr:hypothetical protein [Chitinophagales bacterium]
MKDTNYVVVKGLPADVVFGDPRKKCAGHGICRVTTLGALVEEGCGCLYTMAFLRLNEFNDTITFSFPVELIHRELRETYFKNNTFLMEEDVSIESSVIKSRAILLKKGIYNVIADDNHLMVTIKFTRKELFRNSGKTTARKEVIGSLLRN